MAMKVLWVAVCGMSHVVIGAVERTLDLQFSQLTSAVYHVAVPTDPGLFILDPEADSSHIESSVK